MFAPESRRIERVRAPDSARLTGIRMGGGRSGSAGRLGGASVGMWSPVILLHAAGLIETEDFAAAIDAEIVVREDVFSEDAAECRVEGLKLGEALDGDEGMADGEGPEGDRTGPDKVGLARPDAKEDLKRALRLQVQLSREGRLNEGDLGAGVNEEGEGA